MPDMDVMGCQDLAVPIGVMQHVVNVESSYNPYAIGVVGGRLVRQPVNLAEALATVRMLEGRGYNFSLGLAQINCYNLGKSGLDSYARAFQVCPNLRAGARILADCRTRAGSDWGKAFSCYYSGNFVTGYRLGYVQKVYASMRTVDRREAAAGLTRAIDVADTPARRRSGLARHRAATTSAVARRFVDGPTQAIAPASAPEPERAADPPSRLAIVEGRPGPDATADGATPIHQPSPQALIAEGGDPRPMTPSDAAFVF